MMITQSTHKNKYSHILLSNNIINNKNILIIPENIQPVII